MLAELSGDIDSRLEVGPSPRDLMLIQFLHRGSKNFAQNSWALTGETKCIGLPLLCKTSTLFFESPQKSTFSS